MIISKKAKTTALSLCILPFALSTIISAASATDPTQGRINQRQAANQAEYFQCAKFSIRVFNACNEQAGANTGKVRQCRSHYQGNLSRCRTKFL